MRVVGELYYRHARDRWQGLLIKTVSVIAERPLPKTPRDEQYNDDDEAQEQEDADVSSPGSLLEYSSSGNLTASSSDNSLASIRTPSSSPSPFSHQPLSSSSAYSSNASLNSCKPVLRASTLDPYGGLADYDATYDGESGDIAGALRSETSLADMFLSSCALDEPEVKATPRNLLGSFKRALTRKTLRLPRRNTSARREIIVEEDEEQVSDSCDEHSSDEEAGSRNSGKAAAASKSAAGRVRSLDSQRAAINRQLFQTVKEQQLSKRAARGSIYLNGITGEAKIPLYAAPASANIASAPALSCELQCCEPAYFSKKTGRSDRMFLCACSLQHSLPSHLWPLRAGGRKPRSEPRPSPRWTRAAPS